VSTAATHHAQAGRQPVGRRRRKGLLLLLLFAVGIVIAPLSGGASPAAAAPTSCKPVMVYAVRGSGEAKSPGLGNTLDSYVSALTHLFPPNSVGWVASKYPAVSVARAIFALDYTASVNDGVNRLRNDVTALRSQCPTSKLVLAGYSQGVDVIRRGLPLIPRYAASAVVLFGDPNWTQSESGGNVRLIGDFALNKQGIMRQGNARAILNSRLAYPPPSFSGSEVSILLSYCHASDPVCQGGSNPIVGYGMQAFHVNYTANDTRAAALGSVGFIQGNDIKLRVDAAPAYINHLSSPRHGVVTGSFGFSRRPSSAHQVDQFFTILVDDRVVRRIVLPAGQESIELPSGKEAGEAILATGLRSGSAPVVSIISGRYGIVDQYRIRVK